MCILAILGICACATDLVHEHIHSVQYGMTSRKLEMLTMLLK